MQHKQARITARAHKNASQKKCEKMHASCACLCTPTQQRAAAGNDGGIIGEQAYVDIPTEASFRFLRLFFVINVCVCVCGSGVFACAVEWRARVQDI